MKQIVHGSVIQPDPGNPFRNIEQEEADAQLETLRVLGNAIQQHRQVLARRHDYVVKN